MSGSWQAAGCMNTLRTSLNASSNMRCDFVEVQCQVRLTWRSRWKQPPHISTNTSVDEDELPKREAAVLSF